MGNSTGNTDKKSMKTGQNGKTEKCWNIWEQNAKDHTRKKNTKKTVKLDKINQKVVAK